MLSTRARARRLIESMDWTDYAEPPTPMPRVQVQLGPSTDYRTAPIRIQVVREPGVLQRLLTLVARFWKGRE